MFPASYINVKVPIRELPSTKIQPSQAVTSPSIQKSEPTARALYNFTAETQEDLSLQVKNEKSFSAPSNYLTLTFVYRRRTI